MDKKYLNRVLDHLVNETNFKYSHSGSYVDPTQFTNKERESLDSYIDAPFLDSIYLSSHILHSTNSYFSFIEYGKEAYGLTEDEIEYVWYEYIEILRDKIKHKSLNESTENKFLNTIVDQLVEETGIDYEKNAVYNSNLFVSPTHPFFLTKKPPIAIFSQHCRDIYGLTDPEIEYVWMRYKSIMIDKIKDKPLNESTENKFLDTIVDQLVEETGIDYEKNAVYNSNLFPPSHSQFHLPSPLSPTPLAIFSQHCSDIYGLTEPEIEYVWIRYKSIMTDKIKNKPLNESYFDKINNPQQHKFFNRIADDLMDSIEEIINIQHDDEPLELLLNMGNVDNQHEGFYLPTPGAEGWDTIASGVWSHAEGDSTTAGSYPEYLNQNKDAVDFTYEVFKKIMDNYTKDILNTIQNKWGLDGMDGLFIIIHFFLPKLWNKYYKQDKPSQPLIYSPLPLNESTENKFLDRIVDGLVEESRIEYVEEIVHLANFFFQLFNYPFANLYSIPETSPFYQHCRDVYGLTPEEITYVWTEYRNIIKDKIENVEQEPLNESNYTPKYYAPKWGVRRENDVLDRIVDGLVEESRIEYVEEIVHLANFSFQLFKGPFADLYSIPETSPFYQHCRDVYGLTPEEITYVWTEYRNIIRKEMQSSPLSNLISPFNESINESTEDNTLNKIVSQLVDETQVFNERGQLRANPPFFQSEWEDVEVEGRATGVVGGIPLAELIDSVESKEFDYSLAFMDFKYYCKQMYGLTWEECHEVWDKYREALYNTDFSHLYTPNVNLNESTEDNTLNTIVDQLVDESKIDYGTETVFAPTLLSPDPLLFPLFFSSLTFPFSFLFFDHCRDMYGLTEKETQYVWDKYKKEILKKIESKGSLNESTEDDFLDKIVNQLMGETIINWEEKGISYPHLRSCWYYINDPTPHLTLFTNYITNLYGLTKEEANYIWEKYNDSIIHKIDNNREKLGRWRGGEALNESTGKNFLDNIINKLVGETKLGEKMVFFGDMRAPFNHFPAIRSTEYFIRHCKDYYGLTENEIDYVWKQYKQIIEYKIKSQTSLNENMDKQYKFLEWVISDIKDKTYMQIHERPVIGGFYSTNPLHFIDPIDREESVWRFMYKHYETYYGLTMDEMFYVVERVYPWVAETFLTDYSND